MLKGRKCEQLHMKYKSYIDFIFVVCFKTPYLAILTQTYYSMTSLINFIRKNKKGKNHSTSTPTYITSTDLFLRFRCV